jgi:hypothetical protein
MKASWFGAALNCGTAVCGTWFVILTAEKDGAKHIETFTDAHKALSFRREQESYGCTVTTKEVWSR